MKDHVFGVDLVVEFQAGDLIEPKPEHPLLDCGLPRLLRVETWTARGGSLTLHCTVEEERRGGGGHAVGSYFDVHEPQKWRRVAEAEWCWRRVVGAYQEHAAAQARLVTAIVGRDRRGAERAVREMKETLDRIARYVA